MKEMVSMTVPIVVKNLSGACKITGQIFALTTRGVSPLKMLVSPDTVLTKKTHFLAPQRANMEAATRLSRQQSRQNLARQTVLSLRIHFKLPKKV
jgi:hypothetical protein